MTHALPSTRRYSAWEAVAFPAYAAAPAYAVAAIAGSVARAAARLAAFGIGRPVGVPSLPENPILGCIFEPPRISCQARWTEWKEFQRVCKNRTAEENEYFCIHGQWAATGGYDK
jgi:hypothetical protein